MYNNKVDPNEFVTDPREAEEKNNEPRLGIVPGTLGLSHSSHETNRSVVINSIGSSPSQFTILLVAV